MKIAIPDSPLLSPLTQNVDAVCSERGWSVIRTSEAACADMLIRNIVDVALVSPLGYGKAVGVVDERIIPGPCLMLHDYCRVAGLWFAEGLADITTAASSTPDAFLTIIGSIILAEKFDVSAELQKRGSAAPDCRIDLVTETDPEPALDVSEEWTDITEQPLPVAVWACRIDADIDAVTEAVMAMADPDILETTVVETVPSVGDHFPREGKRTWRWSDDTVPALEQAVELLFYHQHFRELPAIKLLGSDPL